MFNLFTSFGIVGCLFAAPVVLYTMFITAMFVIYKRTGGKRNFWNYMNLW